MAVLVTCCPNFSLPLFVRETSAFSYLTKNSSVLLFSSAAQRVSAAKSFISGRRFLQSKAQTKKSSFSVLCFPENVDISSPIRTLETDLLLLFSPLLHLDFCFFNFLLLIEVKFWYRTGCAPAGLRVIEREHFNRAETVLSDASLCEKNWMKEPTKKD